MHWWEPFQYLIPALAPLASSAAWWIKKRRTRALLARVLDELGLKAQQVGDTWRGGAQAGEERYVLDLQDGANDQHILCAIGLHLYRPDLLAPGHELEIMAPPRNGPPLTLLAGAPSARLADPAEDAIEADALGLLEALWPEAAAQIGRLERYQLEPLRRLRWSDGWLTLERVISQHTPHQRDVSPDEGLVELLAQFVHQMLQVARTFQGPARLGGAALWSRAFHACQPGSTDRQRALGLALRAGPGDEHAMDLWRWVLEHGDLYDVLYLINNHQQRALADISEQRLVAFANTVIAQDQLDAQALPALMSQRLDFGALHHEELDWRARLALLELWLLGAEASERPALTEALARLLASSPTPRQRQLLEVLARAPWPGAAPALCQLRGELPAGPELARAWAALCQAHPERLTGRPEIERALLEALERRAHAALLGALGRVGGRGALPALYAIVEGATQTWVGAARQARRASDQIIERVGGQTRGALSVAAEGGGELSLAEGRGALTEVDPPSRPAHADDRER